MQEPPQTVAEGTGGEKGKGRVVEEPLDEATLQKQKRMIKNRECAVKCREHKKIYKAELEAWVKRLEEENARLLKEKADMEKPMFNQEEPDMDAIFEEANKREGELPVTQAKLEQVSSEIKTSVQQDISRVEAKIDALLHHFQIPPH